MNFFKEQVKPGTVLLYCPYESDEDIQFAKDYCIELELTPDDVAIKIIYADPEKTIKESVIVVKK